MFDTIKHKSFLYLVEADFSNNIKLDNTKYKHTQYLFSTLKYTKQKKDFTKVASFINKNKYLCTKNKIDNTKYNYITNSAI